MSRCGAFVLTLLTLGLPAVGQAEVVARCGSGYLEVVDGYRILHVSGTPYEMGWQHAKLLEDECKSMIHLLFEEKQKEATVEAFGQKFTPEQLIWLIYQLQKRYIPERYIEEMRGMADAIDVPFQRVVVANMIPELFHCSGFALLEDVTTEGTLLHGRILDYGTDWGLQDHAVLLVCEPEGQHPFVNVTYSGFIGSVTGMNAEQISVGEMGGRGLGKWNGTPMSFLVRQVLEEADSLDEAIALFRDKPRTCEYYYVVADGEENRAVGMEASAERFFTVEPGEKHERLPTPVPNTVLLSVGDRYRNLCSKVDAVVSGGEKFSVEQAIRLMDSPVAMKSNLHNALMAPALGKLWVANAASDRSGAWTQPYHAFDFKALLAQPLPESGEELEAPPQRPAEAAADARPANAAAR